MIFLSRSLSIFIQALRIYLYAISLWGNLWIMKQQKYFSLTICNTHLLIIKRKENFWFMMMLSMLALWRDLILYEECLKCFESRELKQLVLRMEPENFTLCSMLLLKGTMHRKALWEFIKKGFGKTMKEDLHMKMHLNKESWFCDQRKQKICQL